jgi:hypothetical protein
MPQNYLPDVKAMLNYLNLFNFINWRIEPPTKSITDKQEPNLVFVLYANPDLSDHQ